MNEAEAERLAKYEKMQCAIQKSYDDAALELAKLKCEGKEKTVAFRSLFAKKLQYKQMLTMYELHGLGANDADRGVSPTIR